MAIVTLVVTTGLILTIMRVILLLEMYIQHSFVGKRLVCE
jgi:hypothetical protein